MQENTSSNPKSEILNSNPTGIALPIQQDGLSYPDRKGPIPIKEGAKQIPNSKFQCFKQRFVWDLGNWDLEIV